MSNENYTLLDKRFICKIISSFCLVVFFSSNTVQSQSFDLIFDHISFNEGLTTGICSNIYQDSRGCIWFGTYSGLVQYDGYDFKVFNPILKDSNSLSGPYVSAMVEDKRGRFWIATNFGLNVYDRSSGKFYRFVHDPNNSHSLNHNYVKVLYYDEATDILWVGTSNGLHSIDLNHTDITQPHKAEFRRYLNKSDDPYSIDDNLIREIVKDNSNRIFVLTNGSYLNLFCKGRFSRIPLGNNVNKTNKRAVVDYKNVMWISTALGYLLKCNLSSYKVQLLQPLKNISSTVYPLRRLLAIDDHLWIASEGAGLLIFNTITGKIDNYRNNLFNPYSLSSDNLLSIFQDRSGIIWLSTNGSAINKYVPNKAKFGLYYPDGKNGLYGKLIRSIIQSKNGEIWIGTDGEGLNKFDRQSNTFIQHKIGSQNQEVLGSKKIFSLYEDHEGIFWIGTLTAGLYKFDMASDKFTLYKNDPNNTHSIENDEIRYIIEDKKFNLWFGTTITGLAVFDRKTGYFYHYKNNPSDTNSINGNRVTALLIDKKNHLYIGTASGAEMVDLSKIDFSIFPPSLIFHHLNFVNINYDINNIYEDSDNNIWFCSGGGGLTKWNSVTGISFTYTIGNGLPSDHITAILEDNQKKLWISTKNGLSKFDPLSKVFKNYDISDGIQSPEFFGACCKTKDGELFFGGVNGFNAFYPDQIQENHHKPTVVLTDLKIFNQSVRIGEKINNRIILTKALSESKEITLSYKENYFSIDFVALDYVNMRKNKYAFQMLGLDDKWMQLGNKREATFSNLDPKEYIFKLKASNNDGIWNEEGTSLRIIILPPWWKTLAFRSFFILTILILISLFFYWRIAAYRTRELELNTLIQQRTEELEKNNIELLFERIKIEEQTEELRAHTDDLINSNELLTQNQKLIQLQSEKLQETNRQLSVLNSTKDKFFSIIAHDLRNPFHAVIGFSELLLVDIDNYAMEKTKKYLGLIHSSSQKGNDLLENLLQWSRSETGKISYEPVSVNLFATAENTINLLEVMAFKKNIQIIHEIDAAIMVLADENMLKTIFRNLISNAIKFTNEQGSITLKARVVHPNVEISVNDTGVGIKEENIKLLFNIESNISTKGTQYESGTGLGLILCKEFVEKHGGKIWVESTEGKGSEFIFTLPIA